MKICPDCQLSMARVIMQGKVYFQCVCSKLVPGTRADTLIQNELHQAQEVTAMNDRLIGNAAYDRVNQQVMKDCPGECGRDYMTQLRIGQREVVVHVCPCGYRSDQAEQEKVGSS